ncbi:hypothetical protein C8J57DRAFT_352329 [Mycena rebaudengoi]|nr:hypothetical protein C8J57DRAFT_352329 [Mycena rebaudengoi]
MSVMAPQRPCHMQHLQEFTVAVMQAAIPAFFERCSYRNCVVCTTQIRSTRIRRFSLSFHRLVLSSAFRSEPRTYWPLVCWTRFDYNPEDQLIPLLTPRVDPNSEIMCPNLQHIRLNFFRALSDVALLEFIQSRTGTDIRDMAHLSSVRVQFSRDMQIDIIPQLQDSISKGLSVALAYFPPPLLLPHIGPYFPMAGIRQTHEFSPSDDGR